MSLVKSYLNQPVSLCTLYSFLLPKGISEAQYALVFQGEMEKSQCENSLSYVQIHCSQQGKNNCLFSSFWWPATCADHSTMVKIQNCTFNMASLCYCWFSKNRSNYKNCQGPLPSSRLPWHWKGVCNTWHKTSIQLIFSSHQSSASFSWKIQ